MERQRIYYGSPVKPSSERQFLQHYGIKDQKWGVQNYQINGEWTEKGLRRRRERELQYRAEKRDRDNVERVARENAARESEERQKKIEDLNRQINDKEAASKKAEDEELRKAKIEADKAAADFNKQKAEASKQEAEAKKQEAEAEKQKADRIKAETDAFKNKLEISKSIQSGLKSSEPILVQPFKKKDSKQNAADRANAYNEARSYSDQQLREAINRIRLENDYVNLTSPAQHSREEKARDVIEGLAAIAGLVTAGAIMVNAIKKAKNEG